MRSYLELDRMRNDGIVDAELKEWKTVEEIGGRQRSVGAAFLIRRRRQKEKRECFGPCTSTSMSMKSKDQKNPTP